MSAPVLYYHGGPSGLQIGQKILPPTVTRAATTADFGARGVCRTDRIYITTDYLAAYQFACLHPSGKGRVYEVTPDTAVVLDPDGKGNHSWECESATIVRSHRVRGKHVKALKKAVREEFGVRV